MPTSSLSPASTAQSLTHSNDILDHLAHSSGAIGIKNVVVPSIGGSHISKELIIGGNRTRGETVRSGHVFVKSQASAKCTDTRKPGCNEGMAKIAEAIAHLLIRLLASRIEGKGSWWPDFDKEHGVLVQLDDEQRDNIDRVTACLKLRRDFERTFDAEKMIEKSSVRAIEDGFIGGELRLAC